MGLFMQKIRTASLFLCLVVSCQSFAVTQTQFNDYKDASIVIGKWLSKSTSHNDILSGTPISTKRQGNQFMIAEGPATQYASDYGFSIMRSPLDSKIISAYEVIGANTATLPKYLELNRFHVGLGIGNKDDITASFIATQDMTLTGWGAGYKRVIAYHGPFFMSYRGQYSRTKRDNFFTQQSFTNDISGSVYLLFFDIYAGVRHTVGIINFAASDPTLVLPKVTYFSKLSELEYFYGISMALTTKLRLGIQANKVDDDYSIAAKLSFHFNSLLPEMDNLFSDPRHLQR